MKSFDPGFFDKQRIPQNLLRTIRVLGEYKGKEEVLENSRRKFWKLSVRRRLFRARSRATALKESSPLTIASLK
jgi:hypothetical protein